MPDDDPFAQHELTQRPRPGAGRKVGGEPTYARPAMPAPAPEVEALAAGVRGTLGIGLNPLVRAASPLLLLAGQLRGTVSAADPAGIRRHALDEIRRFEEQARASGVQHEIVLAARYALCTALDEAVLSTPWGAQSEWAENPLLVALHREAWGGEKFFEMLDRISVDPARHLDLMELQYLILAVGFTGKYQMQDRGHERLVDYQRELHRKIRAQRPAVGDELSLRWQGLEDRRNRLVRYVPWWVFAVAALALVVGIFTMYYSRLASIASPLQARFAGIGLEDFAAPPPVPVSPPPARTLKQLLAADEAAGMLTVAENGARTTITLPSGNLFGSGSAAVNPSYEATLDRVAAALNQVPGRVLIQGHTDDQPIRSLRFRDNYELSRERALGVANILKRTLVTPSRATATGLGSSDPAFRPESDPENRARNRRVEIIHLRGA